MNSKRYARFFIAGFLLIALTAAFRFWLLWRVQYSYMDGEFPWWMQQKEYVHTKGEKSEVIFLGDSRMKAGIIPNQLCENAYNLAVGGGTTIEMYYSLKDYLKYHPKPQMVVMGFYPGHYTGEGCFTSRDLYFHFLPLKSQIEAQVVSYKLKQTDFSVTKSKILDTLKYALIFPQKYSAACINSKFARGDFNHSQFQKNESEKGHMLFGRNEFDNNFNGDANINFVPEKRANYYLHKIISLCKENQIPLFIEQLPMNTTSHQKLSETEFYTKYSDFLKDLERNTGIPVETNIPCYEPEMFGDSSHLNQRGAERFTAEIKEKYSL